MKQTVKKILKQTGFLDKAVNLYFKLKFLENLKLFYFNKKPEMVSWAITGGCNSRCVFCEVPWQINNKKDLPTKRVFDLIDEMHKIGVKQVHLVGGEVFTRTDIFDVLRYLKSKKISIYITTNGLAFKFFNDDKLKIIKNTVSTIAFSLDSSNPEQYEKLRGIPGCFDSVTQAIKITKNLKKINTLMTCVVTKDTISEIPKLVELGSRLGVDYVCFQPLSPITIFAEARAKKDKLQLMPNSEEDLQKLRQCIELGIKRSKELHIETSLPQFKVIAIPYFQSFMNKNEGFFLKKIVPNFKCLTVCRGPFIDYEGSFKTCAVLPETGNVNKSTLMREWNKNKQFRANLKRGNLHPNCAACFCNPAENVLFSRFVNRFKI